VKLTPGTQVILFAIVFCVIVVMGGSLGAWFLGWR